MKGTVTFFAAAITIGYFTLTRLQQARGDVHAARMTLDAFAQLARQRHYAPYLLRREAAMRARVELTQGHLAAAVQWAESSGLSPEDAELPYPRGWEYLTLARVRIVQGRADLTGPFLHDVLNLLDRLLRAAEAQGRMHRALEMLVLQALRVLKLLWHNYR